MSSAVLTFGEPQPFAVRITGEEIADLRRRLRQTRWPGAETVADTSQGVPLAVAREWCRSWEQDYDFGLADRVNAWPQLRVPVQVDDEPPLDLHVLHVRSPEPSARPLLLTHGWPGSVVEFLDVLGPLTDPRRYGGDPADASTWWRRRCPASGGAAPRRAPGGPCPASPRSSTG